MYVPDHKTDQPTLAFKGFDKDLKCRGYQYEVGKTYEHDGRVNPCSSGFHACESPLDVWTYYGPYESRFALVELSGQQKKYDDDSKVAAARIEIKAELTLPEFITKAVDWVIEKCKTTIDGDGVQSSSGYSARIGSSGYSAQIGSSGYYEQIGSSGDTARIGSSGDFAQIGSSGDTAQIGSSGDYARIGSSGYFARIEAKGENSVIASAGKNTIVSGVEGTWISVAEYQNGKCVGFATGCIGKDGLKPDTRYKAKGGKLVEVSQ